MAIAKQRIMPCLWFAPEAEAAANFHCSIFKDSRINQISRYGKEGFEKHGKQPGSVMGVAFEREGQKFVALNGACSSNSARRSPSRSTVRPRRRSTISGTSSAPAAIRRHSSAAG